MTRSIDRMLILAALFLGAIAPAGAQRFQFDSGGGGQFKLDGGGLGGGFSAFGDQSAPPESFVEVSAEWSPATDSQPAMLAVTTQIAQGYHLFSLTQQPGGPLPTKLKVEGARLAGEWTPDAPPKVHTDQEIYGDLPIEEHYDSVTWRVPIELPAGVDPATANVTGSLVGQACTETSCNPVDEAFAAVRVEPGTIPAPLAATEPNSGGSDLGGSGGGGEQATKPVDIASLLPILGAAFVGGLILNLMPCVLPVIGLKVLSFAEQAGHNRAKVLAMNLAYTAGLMAVFMLLAGLAAFAGYGWGELYTHPEFKIGMVVLVFAMALSFLGVWEIPLPGFAGGKEANDLQQKEGFSGAFFKGIFTTILATPCSGPFLGTVFGYTLAVPAWVTFLLFGTIGLGMASPYLVIGLFPSLVKALPKPGAWMETFKQLMGFVLMGTVVYLFSLVSEVHRLPVLTTLVAVAFGCWWIGTTPLTASTQKRMTAWLGGLATSVAIGFLAFSMMRPSDYELEWTAFSPTTLAAAQAEGKTVLVDFTADWCPTCHVNSRVAINTERVKEVVESNGVMPLLADWSDKNEVIKAQLAALGSRSIPFLAIFPAGRPNEPILLPDLITEEQLLEALAEAGAVQANDASAEVPEIEIGELSGPGTVIR